MKKFLRVLALVTSGLFLGAFAGAIMLDNILEKPSQTAADVIAHSMKGIVLVLNSTDGSKEAIEGIGTGFFYGTNTIVTNAHVVARHDQLGNMYHETGHIFIIMKDEEDNEERWYKAIVVFADYEADIAFLRVDDLEAFAAEYDYTVLELAQYGEHRVGDEIYAIGHPWGLLWSVSRGILSNQYSEAPVNFTPVMFWELDAHMFQGNSGGPLIDANGKVVGINSNMVQGNGGSFGFAIPADVLRKVYNDYLLYGKTRWAYIGIAIEADIIAAIVEDGPMDLNGHFQVGDRIVQVEAGDVVLTDISRKSVTYLIRLSDPDKEIFITVLRDGKTYRFGVMPKYKYSEEWKDVIAVPESKSEE